MVFIDNGEIKVCLFIISLCAALAQCRFLCSLELSPPWPILSYGPLRPSCASASQERLTLSREKDTEDEERNRDPQSHAHIDKAFRGRRSETISRAGGRDHFEVCAAQRGRIIVQTVIDIVGILFGSGARVCLHDD